MKDLPVVSVVIPCRNESAHISDCLESIIDNDYPSNRLEIIVVDGSSDDDTPNILQEYSNRYQCVTVLNNEKRTAPAALNIGIEAASGDVIVRLDAHATYRQDYISNSVNILYKTGAEIVGGIIITVPGSESSVAKSIALVTSVIFGVGDSRFRIGTDKARFVDTVPFGAFRKETLDYVGRFDEQLPRMEDTDYSIRVRNKGGKILLSPDIVSYYRARSTVGAFWRHNFDTGFRVFHSLSTKKKVFHLRHIIPLIFLSTLIVLGILSTYKPVFLFPFLSLIGVYLISNLFFALLIGFREKRPKYVILAPVLFVLLHFSYGLGSFSGLLSLLTPGKLLSRMPGSNR